MTRAPGTVLALFLMFILALSAGAQPVQQPVKPPAAPPPLSPLPPQAKPGPRPTVTMTTDGRALTFTPRGPYDRASLRVSAPDGRYFDSEAVEGALTFQPFGIKDYTPPDGSYRWEIRIAPSGSLRSSAADRARRNREDPEAETAHRLEIGRAVIVQSGGFQILKGKVLAGQGAEPGMRRKPLPGQREDAIVDAVLAAGAAGRARPNGVRFAPDQVIPDDLIVQGSACVGLDCVNNEVFGFDTIRLKENNLRIKFDDTSVAAGFPANDWQLTANDSASGGLSKFSVDDITGARTPFTIEAGTPTNALYLDSTGRVGFRTSVPVLDLHTNTGNTPAIRFEQNSTGGFNAQTWDIAGNEANFFVRDVTRGSRLPFRIRPGAPTSSIDIAADGNVGIGTASPQAKLHVFGNAVADVFIGIGSNPGGSATDASALNIGHLGASQGRGAGFINVRPDAGAVGPNPSLRIFTANLERMIIDNQGFVGLGVADPSNPIHHSSGAFLSAGGVWTNASSRDAKDHIRPLTAGDARTALEGLSPVLFTYRAAPDERHVGFIAEDVPDLVATPDRKGLSPMDIVAVLTRVVQEQQVALDAQRKQMAELADRIAMLEAANAAFTLKTVR
jgi:hypothetical protein